MILAQGDVISTDGGPANPAAGSMSVIARRLDALPLTHVHGAILAVCIFALFTDFAEVALSNAFAAIFTAPPYNMPRGSLSLLLASVFVGGAVGAPIFGMLGDRFGRRRALQASLGLMAAGSLAAALSPGLASLTLARAVSGFAIGGFPPLAATYLADVMPPRRRGAMLLVCSGLGSLGGSAVIGLVYALALAPPLGVEPWRWVLGLGAVLAVLGAVLFGLMPESPRWLASVGRTVEADHVCRRFEYAARIAPSASLNEIALAPGSLLRVGLDAPYSAPVQRRRTALFIALYTVAPWATLGFPLLSSVVMLQKGFRVDQSLIFGALSLLGPPLGTTLTALVIDRLERRTCLVALAGTMAVLGTVFAASSTFSALVLSGIAFNTAAATYGGILVIYATEILPTSVRATALAYAWAGGRVSAALAPIVLLPILAADGPHTMFAVITSALVLSGILVLGGPRGLSGKGVA
ncbi:Inner membrane metabolite transport protein YdjE [Methylobacterium cerastii]|uniref:Inner membrane metabolite transport protein YdjE n=1 Tax=Methylobacterium cerastii TaxID=932741 RepID=A0ABQ4QDZ0_9HYPH|nr:MFS transporter [Methylobacterium cerastii]GJD43428.1 Inner membrane metabolite transport protein YdjE [Methylobacterium cerastii]